MNKFGQLIRESREAKEMLLRQLASKIEVDTAMLSKIERGERKAKREQVIQIANYLDLNSNKLIALWLADRIYDLVADETNAQEALHIVEVEMKEKHK